MKLERIEQFAVILDEYVWGEGAARHLRRHALKFSTGTDDEVLNAIVDAVMAARINLVEEMDECLERVKEVCQ